MDRCRCTGCGNPGRAQHEWRARFADSVLFRVGFDFVADEGGDLAQVEFCQQDRHDDLRGAESAHASAAGRLDVSGAAGFHLVVEELDAVAGRSVEFVPSLGAIVGSLGSAAMRARVPVGLRA